MSEWAARKFWTNVDVAPAEDGWQVMLDNRPVKTPGKRLLTLPTRVLAEAVADEWREVEDKIDPEHMHMTRAANSAHEKVAPQHAAVADMLSQYGKTDLLCYRADSAPQLLARQAREWDPLIEWVFDTYGLRLRVGQGVMPIEQPEGAERLLGRELHEASAFELTALHDLVTLSGSLVLALAVANARIGPQDAWRLSRLDEDWQAELWGADPLAAQAADAKRSAFLRAHRLLMLVRDETC